jgi:hypothetical protein
MLIVKRTRGESVHIIPSNNIPPDMTVSELFKDGGIEIHVFKTQSTDASIGINNRGQTTVS